MRSRLLAALASAAIAALPVLAQAQSTPRDAVGIGRTNAFIVLFVRERRICGIAALNARCVRAMDGAFGMIDDAALHSRLPNTGPTPLTGLRRFVRDGDPSQFDPGLAWLDAVGAGEDHWRLSPALAALMDAGSASEMVASSAHRSLAVIVNAKPLMDLLQHLDAAPEAASFFVPADRRLVAAIPQSRVMKDLPAGIRADDVAAAVERVVARIDAAYPAPAFPHIDIAPGVRGDVAFGIASATVGEMADVPLLRALPDSRRFAGEFFARLATAVPQRARDLAAIRDVFDDPSAPQSEVQRRVNVDMIRIIADMPPERKRAFTYGAVLAQLAYNGAVLRDVDSSRVFLGAIGDDTALDAAIPGLREIHTAARATDPADFPAQFRLGVRAVQSVIGASAS
jgi:hypothetical protein